ncbi:YkgJ family cysteine cluster protein [Pseudomonas veronii]|jgi:Fe-S-cluster containining protein|uniref:YkgJ family cysteine cluster protein n=1 Tax=Pseudomonas veronii TaxID=76761 RepID=UPI002659EFC0|nr:YkgJ family cysteine cluster protein [Pseudomonas veronii]WKC45286.1 YkgJ family cysteine cluster protein [Pseudomonas veronii]
MSNGLLEVHTLAPSHERKISAAFFCTKCGLCCKNLDKATAYAHLDRGDGTCVNFDSTSHNCRIYESRPLICRVDDFYEQNLSAHISKSEYIAANLEACADAQHAHKVDNSPTHQERF